MANNELQTMLDVVNHMLNRHPNLAVAIRDLAAKKASEYVVANASPKDLFSLIYKNGLWGKSNDPNRPFFSGSGSHDENITTSYVDSVAEFIKTLPNPPSVVDLGCGDFSIGSRIRPLCGAYTACDIVPELIEFNRQAFSHLGVDFRVLDLASDEIPGADVVFIRQVLQHLSNAQILKLIPKLRNNFKYLVLTEHLPSSRQFTPNLDQAAGPGIRLSQKSGVVLTAPPFDLVAMNESILCEVPEYGGVVRTILYQLRA